MDKSRHASHEGRNSRVRFFHLRSLVLQATCMSQQEKKLLLDVRIQPLSGSDCSCFCSLPISGARHLYQRQIPSFCDRGDATEHNIKKAPPHQSHYAGQWWIVDPPACSVFSISRGRVPFRRRHRVRSLEKGGRMSFQNSVVEVANIPGRSLRCICATLDSSRCRLLEQPRWRTRFQTFGLVSERDRYGEACAHMCSTA